MTHIISAGLVFIGFFIMVACILQSRKLLVLIPFLPTKRQRSLSRRVTVLRSLMLFFLLGYGITALSLLTNPNITGDIFIGFVLFLGAVFVYIGNTIHIEMLVEAKNTLNGFLPICAHCKKMRASDGNPKDPNAWKPLEEYISNRAPVDFTHSICPECMHKSIKTIRTEK